MDVPEGERPEARTRFITNCSSPDGTPTALELAVLDDGRLELSIHPGSIATLTPELAAKVRGHFADGIADSLQGVRWKP